MKSRVHLLLPFLLSQVVPCLAAEPAATFGQGMAEYAITPWKEADPAFKHTPGPADWRAVAVYQIVTDRFDNGDPSNDNIRGWYGAGDWRKAQGGDWRGITRRLDYVKNMGFRAIWISPVHRNITFDRDYKPYHGYHPTDFNTVEPQFGTMADLREMVRAAHDRGIAVILDVVVNHMADLSSAANGVNTWNRQGNGPLKWNQPGVTHAPPFNNLAYFHNNGSAYFTTPDGNPYGDPDPSSFDNEMRGEFIGGLDDFDYDNPGLAGKLADSFKRLLDATDCDGLRVDAVKHVSNAFLDNIFGPVRDHAAKLGKRDFLVYGEAFEGRAKVLASFITPRAMNSMMDFPLHFAMENVFGRGGPTLELNSQGVALADQYPEGAWSRLVRFIDTHDTDRLLGLCSGNVDRVKAALAFLLLGEGVPCVYYGTEQNFMGRRAGDQQRETMWAASGAVDSGPAKGGNFGETPLSVWIRDLNGLRAKHEVFRTGATCTLYSEAAGPGLFVWSRTLPGKEAVIAVNTSNRVRSVECKVATAPGGRLAGVSGGTTVADDGTIQLSVPPFGTEIHISE